MIKPPLSDLWPKLAGWQIAAVQDAGGERIRCYVKLGNASATGWLAVPGIGNCARATVKGYGFDQGTAAIHKAATLARKGERPFAPARSVIAALIGDGDGGTPWKSRLSNHADGTGGVYIELA